MKGLRLSVAGLRIRRADRVVVDNLSFDLGAGQALLVTGPNGAGKSSLLRLLAGLLRPASGAVALQDDADSGGDRTLAERVHFLGHADPVKPMLTVSENLRFWAEFLAAGAPDAAETALAEVGLADLADLPAGFLSAGQRRRLSIARLLAVQRPLWLLDEPTSALDAAAQRRFAALMQSHLAQGGMIVAATHMPLGLAAAQELRLGGISAPAQSLAADGA